MDYERIITSRPVSAQAARQLGKGVHWTPAAQLQDCLDTLPPMKVESFAKERQRLSDNGWTDFTGRVFGRLTVLGLMEKNNDGPSSWVCRCKCGSFCTRKTKSLKSASIADSGFVDRCGRCSYLQKLQSGWTPNLKNRGKHE